MIDIQNDTNLSLLKESIDLSIPESIREKIKNTQMNIDYDDLTDEAFADKKNRSLPIFSPQHAAISSIYIMKQPDIVDESTKERCRLALATFHMGEAISILDGIKEEEKKESLDIPKIRFIIKSKSKLPAEDIEMFEKSASIFIGNINNIDYRDRVEGSLQLTKIASSYGIIIDDDKVNRYAMNADCNIIKTASTLLERQAFSKDEDYRDLYNSLTKLSSVHGTVIKDPNIKKDIASTLMDLDAKNGILGEFDPILDVYNTESDQDIEKDASAEISVNEDTIKISDIAKLSSDDMSELFGYDDDFGSISEQDMITKVANLIESLPVQAAKEAIKFIKSK